MASSAADASSRQKRPRHGAADALDPPPPYSKRPRRVSSSASSIFDPEDAYGVGDTDALYNIFATEPERAFTSVPGPHPEGLVEPLSVPRNDNGIFLRNDTPWTRVGSRHQWVGGVIPGPEPGDRRFRRQDAREERSRVRRSTRGLRGFDDRPLWSSATQPKAVLSSSSSPSHPSSSPYSIEDQETIVRIRTIRSRDGVPLSRERTYTERDRIQLVSSPSDVFRSPTLSPGTQLRTEADRRPDYRHSPLEEEPLLVLEIPNPLVPGDLKPSIDALFTEVNNFAKVYGFGIVKRQGYKQGGQYVRYTLECDRYGQPRASEGAGLRQRSSRKCGCKWKLIAESLQDGQWQLRSLADPVHSRHNHPPSTNPSAHPSHRKLTDPIKAAIGDLSRRSGIRARDVASLVQEQHPDTAFTQRDIYNARALVTREKLASHNPTAALIKLFDENNTPYVAKWLDEETPQRRLVGLVWTVPYCIQMWRRFPEVLSFDNTYNTNRFKLPLFQATSQTCLGSVFNVAFGLIDNERIDGFRFLAQGILQLATKHGIRLPDVIVTDFDKAMKKALDETFPEAQQQICIHHINSNVLLKAKQKWARSVAESSSDSESMPEDSNPQATLSSTERAIARASLQGSQDTDPVEHNHRGVLAMWKRVVFAESEQGHETAWADLCKEFDDQRPILSYLFHTYMPVRAQWARCFVRGYRNFGIRVTSGTEASNNNVKSYLLNGMSHLFKLVEAIQDMLNDQEKAFSQACAQDEVLTSREFLGPGAEYLGELPKLISSKALHLIALQYRITKAAQPTRAVPWPTPLGLCDAACLVSTELGIPCCHTIERKLVGGVKLTKWDVHHRWHLRGPAAADPYRCILDPNIATFLRGRPKNGVQDVPARLALGTMPIQESSQQPASQSNRRRGRPKGSRNKSTLRRLQDEDVAASQASGSQRSTRSQSRAALGAGRSTGVRSSGRQLQASIRRQRSAWECISSPSEGS